MAKQVINIGTTANDGTGDPLRSAFDKVNDNFTELYDADAGDVNSFTNANGTYVSAEVVNTAATGAVTTGVIDLSAVDGSSNDNLFLSKDNTWAEPIYYVPAQKTKEAFTITNATTTSLNLGQAPSPNNTNYADLYINGVYQNAANFTIASSTLQLTGGVYFPNGASVEVVITY